MEPLIDADRSWIRDLEHVFKYGNRVSPRGMLCYESLGLQSVVSMQNPIIFNKRRELGYKFMAAEAAWILEGRDDVAVISKYSKEISKFSDDGKTFFGAYGPKVKDQIDYIVGILLNDIHSRQAVINIWRENPMPTKDVPCTLSLQFIVRNSTIHCIASMRSSDLWLGHPYDIFNFSAIAFAISLHLSNLMEDRGYIQLGKLYLTAGSKHIYEKNAEAVGDIIKMYGTLDIESVASKIARVERTPCFVPERYDDANEFIADLWDAADSAGGAFTLMFK